MGIVEGSVDKYLYCFQYESMGYCAKLQHFLSYLDILIAYFLFKRKWLFFKKDLISSVVTKIF